MIRSLCKSLLAGAALLATLSAQAEVKTITDVLGREVKVDVPAQRVVLGFYYPDYIAATGAENFKHVVGISREFWEKFNPGSWKLFNETMPELAKMPDVGNVNTGDFSTEKTLALNPSVIVLADWQYKTLQPEMPRFEQAGIPVVVVDFNAQTVERHTQSARIFGQLAGTEARANKLADEYAAGIADIQKRVASAKQDKPRIYVEFGDKGPANHSFTFGKNMWGAIADTAGGDNIAAGLVENWGPINPEQVLAARPDVIMISGTENGHEKNPSIMAMGIGISQADAEKRLAGFVGRPGWASLPAVENKRVYGLYHSASRSLMDLASTQFIAKALYPAQFKDVDPEKTFLDFYRNYLPVVPEGTFFLQMK